MDTNLMPTLDSYDNFEDEQEFLETKLRKEEEQEQRIHAEERNFAFRFKCMSGYFLRSSWKHKKEIILELFERLDSDDHMLRSIHFLSILFSKVGTYADVSPHCKHACHQIIINHDRGLDGDALKEAIIEDQKWVTTLPSRTRMLLIIDLLRLAGGGLMRKVYIPFVNIYNRKLMDVAHEKEKQITNRIDETSILYEPDPDDSDKYPRDHQLTIDVEKLRKKWDEIVDKFRGELFPIDTRKSKVVKLEQKVSVKEKRAKTVKKKAKVAKRKESGGKVADSIDWIQMLPVWIVKKILNYFDQKTLQNLKKVNSYWAYICDSLIKDKQTRGFLNETIRRLVGHVDSDILKEYRETEVTLEEKVKKPENPREKRAKSLMKRGAVLESLRPVVKKSRATTTCILSSKCKTKDTVEPDQVSVFPRLIRDDLLLYKKYPCILKDVNVIFDVDYYMTKQRQTLCYRLSQEVSDTFNMTEVTLADW